MFYSWFLVIVRQLVQELINSLSHDSNLVPFHLWWREVMLKIEQICECFNFVMIFNSLKMHWNFKNDQFLVEKSKTFHKYCTVQLEQRLVSNLYLTQTVQNITFWNISYLGLCCNWMSLNIKLKSQWVFWNSKIVRKCKIKGSEPISK